MDNSTHTASGKASLVLRLWQDRLFVVYKRFFFAELSKQINLKEELTKEVLIRLVQTSHRIRYSSKRADT